MITIPYIESILFWFFPKFASMKSSKSPPQCVFKALKLTMQLLPSVTWIFSFIYIYYICLSVLSNSEVFIMVFYLLILNCVFIGFQFPVGSHWYFHLLSSPQDLKISHNSFLKTLSCWNWFLLCICLHTYMSAPPLF